jgi:hypothetical protein
VRRLIVLCRHPYHLHREEASSWLAGEVRAVIRDDALPSGRLTLLRRAGEHAGDGWGWLIELQLPGTDATIARHSACAGLLADLRLLGMSPRATIADDAETLEVHLSWRSP